MARIYTKMRNEFITRLLVAHRGCASCPSPEAVSGFFKLLLGLLFPEHSREPCRDEECLHARLVEAELKLNELLSGVAHTSPASVAETVSSFFAGLPDIHARLQEDVLAMFEGDPAARSASEVIRCYPGFYAVAAYRTAHAIFSIGVPEIPRMLTEHAHSHTGIDIHPGAKIGRSFCIDHGTGIVIGETAEIGDHVKVYQGVTLGALSVSKTDAQTKRHPTVEDHVILYAGATILGGKTIVGRNSIIGGNVWLTKSVPENSRVYYHSAMHHAQAGITDLVVIRPGQENDIA